MDAYEFVYSYDKFIGEIELVIKTELLTVFKKLKDTDPTDLVTPETWFVNTNQA